MAWNNSDFLELNSNPRKSEQFWNSFDAKWLKVNQIHFDLFQFNPKNALNRIISYRFPTDSPEKRSKTFFGFVWNDSECLELTLICWNWIPIWVNQDHSKISFRINPKIVLNLVWCTSVKNQSGSIRMNPKFSIRINPGSEWWWQKIYWFALIIWLRFIDWIVINHIDF